MYAAPEFNIILFFYYYFLHGKVTFNQLKALYTHEIRDHNGYKYYA